MLVQLRHPEQLLLERGMQPLRQQRGAILAAFPGTDVQHPTRKVDVLDPQRHTFVDAQARAIHQFRHQPDYPGHLFEDGFHFLAREDHRYPVAPLHPLEPGHFAQWLVQYRIVEKDQGVECLGLRGRGKAPLTRQMIQEGFQLLPAHGVRVALPMEIDELPNPGAVAVFSAGAEVPAAADDGNLIEQTRWRGLTP